MSAIINLDLASTTPPCQAALRAVDELGCDFSIPTSAHHYGLRARQALQQARERVAQVWQTKADEIIFTSSGTEAANLAILGAARSLAARGKGKHMLTTAVEHPAVLRAAQALEQEGWELTILPVGKDGSIRAEVVQAALREATSLVSIQLASHDLGTIQPMREISAVTRSLGIILHVDASACAAWMPFQPAELGADLLHVSSHRFFGPQGAGILYRRAGVGMQPLMYGGAQESGLRPGTENIPAIVGAAAALEWSASTLPTRASQTAQLRNRLLEHLQKNVTHFQLNGTVVGDARLPHHAHLSFEGVEGEALVLRLDLQGVLISGPTGCTTRAMKLPSTLRAIGLSPTLAQGSILIGVDPELSLETMDIATAKIVEAVNKLRGMSLRWKHILQSSPSTGG